MNQHGVPNLNEWKILKAASRKYQTVEDLHKSSGISHAVLWTVCRSMRMNGWLEHKYQPVEGQGQDISLYKITPLGSQVQKAIQLETLIKIKPTGKSKAKAKPKTKAKTKPKAKAKAKAKTKKRK